MAAKIIAELCQNHNGNLKTLGDMVNAVAEAGADYAKIQTIFADDLTFRERFEQGRIEAGTTQILSRPYHSEYDRLKSLDLNADAHRFFLDLCRENGVKPLTTIFSRSRIPLVHDLGFDDVKVASYDCASYPMIRELKDKFTHLFISTGATHDEEVQKTAETLKDYSYSFMHCVTVYPTPLVILNLTRMNYLRGFTKQVGFSDHTLVERDGLKAALVALWLGADVIERHFTILERGMTKDGPVSIDSQQLKALVEFAKMGDDELERDHISKIPEYESMIGKERPGLSHEERMNRDYYRGRFASKVNGKTVFNWEETPDT